MEEKYRNSIQDGAEFIVEAEKHSARFIYRSVKEKCIIYMGLNKIYCRIGKTGYPGETFECVIILLLL